MPPSVGPVFSRHATCLVGATQDLGVTELGKKWIEETVKQKIVVDCSHSSNQTCIDAALAGAGDVLA